MKPPPVAGTEGVQEGETMLAGDLITIGMLALCFVMFLLAFIWAWRHRQLQDIEQVKYKVFEEEDDPLKNDL